jgi:hypothetical protein
MELDAAQLSSLSTGLHGLVERITAIADGFQGTPREDVAADLYDVERHLKAAHRRLTGLVDRLERTHRS